MYNDPTGHFGEGIVNWAKNKAAYISKKASDTWDDVKETASNLYNGAKQEVTNLYNDAKGAVSNFGSNVSSEWNNFRGNTTKKYNEAKSYGSSAITNLQSNISKKTDNMLSSLKSKMENACTGIFKEMNDALGNSYEATKCIAPYTRFVMNVNKKVNPFYWAFDYSTEKGWFKEEFDIGGFYSQEDNGVYHAKQNGSVQSFKYAGYNNLYDAVFNGATDMDKAKFQFSNGDKDYVFWAWKGDYLNLGAGAEMGIYERAKVNGNQTNHWLVNQDLAMPITLNVDYKGKQIISYDPKRDDKLDKEGQGINKWWVTGFNPHYDDVNAKDLTVNYTVDFSDKKDMYDAFINSRDYLRNSNKWSIDDKNKYVLTFKFK